MLITIDPARSRTVISAFLGAFVAVFAIATPVTQADMDYGEYYSTPGPYSQMYYQPMYAYAASPVQSNHNPYQQNQYGYAAPQNQYSYYAPQQNQFGYGSQNQYVYNNTPINQYQPQYGQQYYPQQYSYPQYNSYPSYGYSQPGYGSSWYGQGYNNMYGHNVPYSSGYPTGDTVPWIGGQLCDFPDYDGRALCGSNPNQYIYDPWTGSWY